MYKKVWIGLMNQQWSSIELCTTNKRKVCQLAVEDRCKMMCNLEKNNNKGVMIYEQKSEKQQ